MSRFVEKWRELKGPYKIKKAMERIDTSRATEHEVARATEWIRTHSTHGLIEGRVYRNRLELLLSVDKKLCDFYEIGLTTGNVVSRRGMQWELEESNDRYW